MYPYIHPSIRIEKRQPDYSTFYIFIDGTRGAIELNESAADIMNLCNGKNTISKIAFTLASRYSDKYDEVYQMVSEFINDAVDYGHIYVSEAEYISAAPLLQYGDRAFWSPDVISIELTQRCHLKCKHCYVDAGSGCDFFVGESLHQIKKILRNYPTHIQLTGGEPLLHPEFFSVLSLIIDSDIPVTISTSGAIQNKSTIESFRNFLNKDIVFQISLDGLETYHDAFRGVPGCFQDTIYFIQEIIKMQFKVYVCCTVSSQTASEVEQLCNICKEIGVAGVRLGSIVQKGRAIININDDNKRNDNLSKMIKTLYEKYHTDDFGILRVESSIEEHFEENKNCGYGCTMLHISANNDVYPCIYSSYKMGNLASESLEEILKRHGEAMRSFNAPNNNYCEGCDYCNVCRNCITEGLYYCDVVSNCKWKTANIEIIQLIQG